MLLFNWLHELIFIVTFIFFSLCIFRFSFLRIEKIKTTISARLSALIAAVTMVVLAILVIRFDLLPYPYIGFLNFWNLSLIIMMASYMVIVKIYKTRTSRINTEKIVDDGENVPRSNGGILDPLQSRHELLRKTFHLAGFLVILSFYVVTGLLTPKIEKSIVNAGNSYVNLWGPFDQVHWFSSTLEARILLTLFALIATLMLSITVDIPRLALGKRYSLLYLLEKKGGKILRQTEMYSPGPHLYIAASSSLAWAISMLFLNNVINSIEIAIASIMISTIADGSAAVIGKYFGKHIINRPFNQKKSLEGFVAGFITAFFSAVPFVPWYLALVAALVFLLVDYISLPVADNMINPIIIVLVLIAIASL
ncbi:MAG: hypothetical protein ACTSXP_02515 [Promethearchaeota archaeon]